MAVVEIIFTKETETFTPFLEFRSAATDPKLAVALTRGWKQVINSAVRRIYSGKCDHFLDAFHFLEKNEKKFF